MAATPAASRTLTLFDLVAAVQESLTTAEEAAGLAVPVVQDLLHRVARRAGPRRASGGASPGVAVPRDAAA